MKDAFNQVDKTAVEYVIDAIKSSAEPIANYRNYIISVLFNYLTSLVDMKQPVKLNINFKKEVKNMRAREFEELYTQIMDGLEKGMQERRLTPDNFFENLNWMRNSLIDQMTALSALMVVLVSTLTEQEPKTQVIALDQILIFVGIIQQNIKAVWSLWRIKRISIAYCQ